MNNVDNDARLPEDLNEVLDEALELGMLWLEHKSRTDPDFDDKRARELILAIADLQLMALEQA